MKIVYHISCKQHGSMKSSAGPDYRIGQWASHFLGAPH